MTDHDSWEIISGADASQVVLGVDFPVRWCREASFRELASRIGSGYRFLQTRPPMARICQRLCSDAYVGPWIEGIQRDRQHVLAVLGYRTGSVYAAAVAESISRWQPMPKIILFDPQFSSVELLAREFHREHSMTSSLLSVDEIERLSRVEDEIYQAAGNIADIAAVAIETYLETITPAFERVGLGDARANKFTRFFESYVSWISVAYQIDPSLAWRSSTGIASSTYAELPARAHLLCGNRDIIGRMISFDVGHADLLRSDSVAQAVTGLLESR